MERRVRKTGSRGVWTSFLCFSERRCYSNRDNHRSDTMGLLRLLLIETTAPAKSKSGPHPFDLHCRPFVLIGKYYLMFDSGWTCLSASGKMVVFEDSPSSESTQVSGGNSNNRFQGNDTKERYESTHRMERPSVGHLPLGKRAP